MNRRRKVGSTFLLSSLAALSIVGMGLAAGLVDGNASFDILFKDNTTPEYGSVSVVDADSIDLEVVLTDDGETIGFTQDIVFTFTPGEDAPENVVLNLEASFTADEGTDVTQYLTIGNPSLVLDPDVGKAAPITFTLSKDALGITLAQDVTFEAAKAGLEGKNAKVRLDYSIAEKQEPAPVEPVVSGVSLDKDSVDLTVGEGTDTLTATVTMDPADSPAAAVEWSFSEGYEKYISVTGTETSTITISPVAEGTVTVTAKAGEKTDTATINVKAAPVVEDTSISQMTKEGEKYTIQGVVDAKTTQGLVVTDGTASTYVYFGYNQGDALNEYNIGDEVRVSGTANSFNGFLQFSLPSSSTKAVYDGNIEKVSESTGIKAAEATELTKDIADSWATKESFVQTDMAKYTWNTVAGKSGNYNTLNLAGSDIVIEPSYYADDDTIVEGAGYTVTAYFAGYNSNYKYAAVYITDLQKTSDPTLTSIEIKGQNTVNVGKQITLEATPNPGASLGEVVWKSSDEEVATVENGVVTGLKEGTTKITASSGDIVSQEFQVTVVSETSTARTYTHTFQKDDSLEVSGGTIDLDGITWTYDAATYIGWDSNNKPSKGIQIGSGSNPVQTWTIHAPVSSFEGTICQIAVNASMGSSGDSKLSVSINGTALGETTDLTTSAADYSFNATEDITEGEAVITITNTKKAAYLKSITVQTK